jgi:imidazolonepropionase-like amidohydrolase
MKHHLIILGLIASSYTQAQTYLIKNTTVHTGTGTLLEHTDILIKDGKIAEIGSNINDMNAKQIDASDKHVYPGFVALNTKLGLEDVEAVRATRDFAEVGSYNPSVRSMVAFNTDSRILPTVTSNGVLLAQVVPQWGLMPGTSSAMRLRAWNWEDAVIAEDNGLHLNWPRMYVLNAWWAGKPEDQQKETEEQLKQIHTLFEEAFQYCQLANPEVKNIHFEAFRNVFLGKGKLYIQANFTKEIIAAVNFCKQYNIKPVIVGGTESDLITDFLKENQVSVVLYQPHALPEHGQDDVNSSYERAVKLHKAGVDVAISIEGSWQQRNLPFMAGTLTAFGMPDEEALKSISLTPAKILGIDKNYGSIEKGKSATLFICTGNALDMMTSTIELEFLDGNPVDLENFQYKLYQRFNQKYK